MQTPFVRQNTPHPKELKAKARKLFDKGKVVDAKAADGKAPGGKAADGKAAAEQLVSELLRRLEDTQQIRLLCAFEHFQLYIDKLIGQWKYTLS